MTTTTCRGCGKPIVFAMGPNGKLIPLDPKPHVYTVESESVDSSQLVARLVPGAMVTHFATCTAANQFSGSGVKKP